MFIQSRTFLQIWYIQYTKCSLAFIETWLQLYYQNSSTDVRNQKLHSKLVFNCMKLVITLAIAKCNTIFFHISAHRMHYILNKINIINMKWSNLLNMNANSMDRNRLNIFNFYFFILEEYKGVNFGNKYHRKINWI